MAGTATACAVTLLLSLCMARRKAVCWEVAPQEENSGGTPNLIQICVAAMTLSFAASSLHMSLVRLPPHPRCISRALPLLSQRRNRNWLLNLPKGAQQNSQGIVIEAIRL